MSWAFRSTGRSDVYWLNRIGRLIFKHSWRIKGKVHRECDCLLWLSQLAEEVERSMGPPKKSDVNMRLASVLGYLLVKWFVRLGHAKAYDPRRPRIVRRKAMKRMEEYVRDLVGSFVDESCDSRLFPKQDWDAPFSSKAKDGKYR